MGSAGAAAELDAAGLRVALVVSRFNESFCERLLAGALAELSRLGVNAADLHTVHVPGALEVPLALQWLAQSGRFDALVALGVVIRGETYHFEIVSNESARGVAERATELEGLIVPCLNRSFASLSPVERAILYIGTFELCAQLHTPFKVIVNEAIELGKSFGGTDGHKFVNGVLEKLAANLRPVEFERARGLASRAVEPLQ